MARGNWTPVDASPAGLAFVSAAGNWTTLENFVFASFTVVYPTTSDKNTASIGGLPIPNGPDFLDLHLSSLGTGVTHWLLNSGATAFVSEISGATAAKLNSDLSGKTISGTFLYRAT